MCRNGGSTATNVNRVLKILEIPSFIQLFSGGVLRALSKSVFPSPVVVAAGVSACVASHRLRILILIPIITPYPLSTGRKMRNTVHFALSLFFSFPFRYRSSQSNPHLAVPWRGHHHKISKISQRRSTVKTLAIRYLR